MPRRVVVAFDDCNRFQALVLEWEDGTTLHQPPYKFWLKNNAFLQMFPKKISRPMISWMNAGDGLGIWMAHCFPRGLAALHRQCSELYGLFQRKNIMDGKLKAAARDLVGIWLGSGEPREAPNMT